MGQVFAQRASAEQTGTELGLDPEILSLIGGILMKSKITIDYTTSKIIRSGVSPQYHQCGIRQHHKPMDFCIVV